MNMHAPIDRQAVYEKINAKLNKSWTSADYSQIGIRLQIVGEMLAAIPNTAVVKSVARSISG